MQLRFGRARVALILLVVVVLYGLALGLPMFYRIAYLLAITLGAAYLWGVFALWRLEAEVANQGSRGQVGDVFPVQTSITNRGLLPKPAIEVAALTNMPGMQAARVIKLAGRSSEDWTSHMQAHRRGVFSIGPIVATATDPFGLFSHQRRLSQTKEILVYPAAIPLPHFYPFRDGAPEEGAVRKPTVHTTPNAASVREYTSSDTLSRIHWPTTARTGRIMVKQFDEDIGSDVWLLLDLHRDVQAGHGEESTEEYLITAAASIASRVLSMGFAVGVMGLGATPLHLPSSRGKDHLARILEALAWVHADGTAPLPAALERARRQGIGHRNLLIVTPNVGPQWVESAGWVFRNRDRTACVLLDSPSFGGRGDAENAAVQLAAGGVRSYILRRGEPISAALGAPAGRHRYAGGQARANGAPA